MTSLGATEEWIQDWRSEWVPGSTSIRQLSWHIKWLPFFYISKLQIMSKTIGIFLDSNLNPFCVSLIWEDSVPMCLLRRIPPRYFFRLLDWEPIWISHEFINKLTSGWPRSGCSPVLWAWVQISLLARVLWLFLHSISRQQFTNLGSHISYVQYP